MCLILDCLKKLGFSTLRDYIRKNPENTLFSLSETFTMHSKMIPPIEFERHLKEECLDAGDLDLFFRTAILTVLNGRQFHWPSQHYMMYGELVGILGGEYNQAADSMWDNLMENPPDYLEAKSVYDPLIDRLVNRIDTQRR